MAKSQRLTQQDLARLAGAVAELYHPSNPGEPPAGVVKAIAHLLACPLYLGITYPHITAELAPLFPEFVTNYNQKLITTLVAREPDSETNRRRVRLAEEYSEFFPRLALTPNEWHGSFEEYAVGLGDMQDGMSVAVILSDGSALGTGMLREPRFGPKDQRLLELLRPHLVRAFGARVTAQRAFGPDGSAPAAILFRRDGRAELLNTAARRLLGEAGSPARIRLEDLAAFAAELFASAAEGRLPMEGAELRWHGLRIEYSFSGGEAGQPSSAERVLLSLRPGRPAEPEPARLPPPADGSPSEKLLRRLTVAGLSPAETEVARLLSRGLAEKEIARRLSRTRDTVKFHLGRIYRKCGVRSRGEWMAWLAEPST